mmetsp:Transcript_35483/g.80582  ORF Transcript_35483/g.80582 Transcript_35483/m.80582 type:complete len:237 (-) Transcript_35483:724-1434(-)
MLPCVVTAMRFEYLRLRGIGSSLAAVVWNSQQCCCVGRQLGLLLRRRLTAATARARLASKCTRHGTPIFQSRGHYADARVLWHGLQDCASAPDCSFLRRRGNLGPAGSLDARKWLELDTRGTGLLFDLPDALATLADDAADEIYEAHKVVHGHSNGHGVLDELDGEAALARGAGYHEFARLLGVFNPMDSCLLLDLEDATPLRTDHVANQRCGTVDPRLQEEGVQVAWLQGFHRRR